VIDSHPPGLLERAGPPKAAVDAALGQRIHALVGGVEVDLDAPLLADDERAAASRWSRAAGPSTLDGWHANPKGFGRG
jgi:hypothetical protein